MPSRRVVPARLPEATPPRLPSARPAVVLTDHGMEDEAVYRGLDFCDLDLTGRVARSVEFDGCHFDRADLGGMVLDKGTFVDCLVENCNLANVRADEASLRRVRISVARMTGFQWINGVLRDVALRDCRLDLSTFRFCRLTDVV